MSELSEERQRLASTLRALRMEAGLSTTELANRLGFSQPKVSKMELGRTLPNASDVDAWARVTGAHRSVRERLVAIARKEGNQVTEVRRELAPGRRRAQEYVQRLETAATIVRVFSPNLVVGLAQTADFADAVFRLGRRVGPAEEARVEVVRARLARQQVLDDESKQFFLLMAEGAFHRRLIPPTAMRAQLARLTDLSRRANITMGVIPYDSEERVHQYHGFSVLGDPDVDDESVVLVSTLTRRLTIRSAAEIDDYLAHFEALRAAALEGDALRRFLREVIADLPTE